MKRLRGGIYYDPQDHELLAMVNEVLERRRARQDLKSLFDPHLHPNGIKELAASRELRIASAVINLLESLQAGRLDDRLRALRSVRDEVLHCAPGHLRHNTGRVLLQIMKELVRAHGDYRRQLRLAHDFRLASTGKPRIVRAQLRRYHLLEMPEAWNQLAFDDHVHDANTKGRKSPTHLIMDAWIKGIRSLTVIYYNFIRPEAAAEVLEAAEIMGLAVRLGVEFSARFHGRFVQLIWTPRGFSGTQDFLNFLAEPAVMEFMAQGREVSTAQQAYVLQVLEEFNQRHRRSLETASGLKLAPLEAEDFLVFVGQGQAAILHLGEYIHLKLQPALQSRLEELRASYALASPEEAANLEGVVEELNKLDSEALVERYLRPQANPGLVSPNVPRADPAEPALLKHRPRELIELLSQLHHGFRITLNLSNLDLAEVIELLYDCDGLISHLEIFNLKDFSAGKTGRLTEINELQQAINNQNVILVKRIVKRTIARLEASPEPAAREQARRLEAVLNDVGGLVGFYASSRLQSSLGSDSTGRSRRSPGMGLVIRQTLPLRARRALRRSERFTGSALPVKTPAYLQATFLPARSDSPLVDSLYRTLRHAPGLRRLGFQRHDDWLAERHATRLDPQGNITALGGVRREETNGLTLNPRLAHQEEEGGSLAYLNTGLANGLKVLVGFLPAFLTFFLTREWWLLGYGGAVIWFGVTGLRNVLQSVLGGGGVRRSPLLTWSNYVNWGRIADSLFFTGFSVPLLDYVVKTVLLDRGLGVTTATNPVLLYLVLALANGLYIAAHNAFRGLPRAAIFGNFLRTFLSFPLAVAFNDLGSDLLAFHAAPGVEEHLESWAAIISKAASDCVAGIIEGLSDRAANLKLRGWDYAGKLKQLFDAYARLEILFPQADVLEMLESPQELIKSLGAEPRNLEKVIAINALDLLYFWMYQPRARSVLARLVRSMTVEERQILVRSQAILQRYREISQFFVDGLVGKKFSRALSFYLERAAGYLQAIQRLTVRLRRD